jgi:hypothetical protein
MAELIRLSRDADFEEIAAFQRRAFGYEWLKSERRRLQCAEYYRWKYFPPTGPAWLALVRSRQQMVAMVAAVPFDLATGEGAAWQICDIATHPQFRHRGFFASCLAALSEAVAGDVMFCFPNKQSRAGLIRAGYAARSMLRVHARPLFPLARRKSAAAGSGAADLAECDAAFWIDPRRHRYIRRSPEFLRWRYAAHPLNRYVALRRPGGGGTGSCVVVRRMFDGRVGMVVENWSGSEEGAAQEAGYRWAKSAGCLALLWARDPLVPSPGNTRAGLNWQLPWKIVCYTNRYLESSSPETADDLHVQLGDWDAV